MVKAQIQMKKRKGTITSKTIRVSYDAAADCAYIYLKKRIRSGEVAETREGSSWGEILFDYDRKGRLIGIEVIGAKSRLPKHFL